MYAQWCSGSQARLDASGHLIFLLSHRLDASRHFLAIFIVIFDHIGHLNFTDGFEGEGFALEPNSRLTNSFQTFPFPLPFGTLHSDA